MAKNDNIQDLLHDVAEAIRAKKGTTDLISPQYFSSEIASIESGSTEVEDAIVTRTITSYSNDRIRTIGGYAFMTCDKLKDIHIPLVDTLGVSCFYQTGLRDVILPSVATISYQAFRNCTHLNSVVLEYDGVISISSQAFYASSLTYLIIKSSYRATLESSSLYNTNIEKGTGYIYVQDNLVEDYKAATNWSVYADQIRPLSEYVYLDFADPVVEKLCAENFGDGIGTTQAQANAVTKFPNIFKYNTEITSFDEFEKFENITDIIYDSFYGCTKLKSIRIPNNVSALPQNMFNNCSSLERVEISNNSRISTIKFLCFDACVELTSINIPSGVTSIEFYAFRCCESLTKVTCRNSTPPTAETNIFHGIPTTPNIYVPDDSVEAYKSATNWAQYADRIKPLSEYQPNNE